MFILRGKKNEQLYHASDRYSSDTTTKYKVLLRTDYMERGSHAYDIPIYNSFYSSAGIP